MRTVRNRIHIPATQRQILHIKMQRQSQVPPEEKRHHTPHSKAVRRMRQAIHTPSSTRHILHKEMPKGSRSKTTQAAKAWHRKSKQPNLRNMQYPIHSKHPCNQALLQRMQERSQTQSRQRIHAQMASKKPRKERRATQTRRPPTTQAAHTPLARATPRRSESPSQSIPPSKPRIRERANAQVARRPRTQRAPLRKHEAMGHPQP